MVEVSTKRVKFQFAIPLETQEIARGRGQVQSSAKPSGKAEVAFDLGIFSDGNQLLVG